MKKILEKINVFMVSVAIFILTVFYCVMMFVLYNRPVDLGLEKANINIEVSLPVLELNKYEELSKKIDISANTKVKRRVAEKDAPAGGLIPR